MDSGGIVFIDTEVDPQGKKILDLGAIKADGRELHKGSRPSAFSEFISVQPHVIFAFFNNCRIR